MTISRRSFVQAMGVALLTPFTIRSLAETDSEAYARFVLGGSTSSDEIDNDGLVFDLSVASGDPSQAGVVLWTHVNPEAYISGQSLYVDVALDEGFTQPILSAEVNASDITAERDYTVNIDLEGYLLPDQRYFYRFKYGNLSSRTGRCHTLPSGSLENIKMAVVTCQDYTTGYFNAYSHIADEDVHCVLHLGDFIYEYAEYEGFEDSIVHSLALPSGGSVAMDLEDYRHIYKEYRKDKNLQRAMEMHSFIITWDDHETADNAYWDYERDTLGVPSHPYQTGDNNPDQLRQLRRDAQQAWIEYVPARVKVNESASHAFDYLQIYRSFQFGDLVDLYMTDSRTYRTKEPCKDGTDWENYWCTDYEENTQTMLGETQRDWLIDGVANSTARWKVWGNQTLLAQLAGTVLGRPLVYANYDAWDGYQWEREQILSSVKDSGTNNFVVLTGDLHSSIASYLKVDFKKVSNWNYDNLVGVELMTPSISSPNLNDTVEKGIDVGSIFTSLLNGGVQVNNPHIKDFVSNIYGYAVIEFNVDELNWTVYSIDKKADNPSTAKNVYKKFNYEPVGMWLTEK
ncbi:alkaline phosphatase D family protein [Microbulbifer sp. OS29]|uniref:Alkaline phosphatase D family protein n=1 Tax=Microbulbifer okhotskensis TaxID=2926617 RepID=A0A9X2J9G8_9GAMM|nr:alkaline phosphatase D family protein [Microbulbifer okhotskensis]MCO1336631.1 alkaline phosphatase D family protein [Microbulbifer okhotskensis]